MQVALVLGGAVLLLVAFLDAIETMLAPEAGGGPVTRRVCSASVQLMRRGTPARLRPGMRAYSGPAVLLFTGILWVLGMWAGWTMISASDPEAVVDAQTNVPATVADRVYFVAFVIFTLGVGDFVPGPGSWRIATSIATFGGLFLITLTITYLGLGRLCRRRTATPGRVRSSARLQRQRDRCLVLERKADQQ